MRVIAELLIFLSFSIGFLWQRDEPHGNFENFFAAKLPSVEGFSKVQLERELGKPSSIKKLEKSELWSYPFDSEFGFDVEVKNGNCAAVHRYRVFH